MVVRPHWQVEERLAVVVEVVVVGDMEMRVRVSDLDGSECATKGTGGYCGAGLLRRRLICTTMGLEVSSILSFQGEANVVLTLYVRLYLENPHSRLLTNSIFKTFTRLVPGGNAGSRCAWMGA